jgi:hypothetical protein
VIPGGEAAELAALYQRAIGAPDGHAELAAFKAAHPDVRIHAETRSGDEVWYADGPTWRLYGRGLAEFVAKLRTRFPSRRQEGG